MVPQALRAHAPQGCCTHHLIGHGRRPRAAATSCRATEVSQVIPLLTTVNDPDTASVLPSLITLADVQAGADAVSAAVVPVPVSSYTPGPVEVGWQIWFAAAVSTVPFVIGAYEFGKRILIQRRCKVCGGSGLVQRGRYQRKCPECGGFFPWISWRMFLSANARPGNGGPLLQPRGQTSVFYTVPLEEPQVAPGPNSSTGGSTDDQAQEAAGVPQSPVQPQQQQQQQQHQQQSHS